jgi:hypothetical protein
MSITIPFASLILVFPKIWSLVFANTWFDLITGNVVQLVHDSPSLWPSHMLCSIAVFSLSAPKVSYLSCRWANPTLGYTPQPTPLENPRETFQSTSYMNTVDAIRVSSKSSDYVLTSRSKDYAATLIILQREHHDTILLQMILWVMSIMALSTSGMISSSISCNAPWSGNLDH